MTNKRKIGVVMDPIESIHAYKDTTLAMMLSAKKFGYDIFYMQQKDLWLRDGEVWASAKIIDVYDENDRWFEIKHEQTLPLAELDVVLMRKDPPFDIEYIYTTYLLEIAEAAGVLVINKPQSLRDANEKLFSSWFPDVTPPQLVTRDAQRIKEFIEEQKEVVLKPLHGMGGGEIFKVSAGDANINVIIEVLTKYGTSYIMAQQFIPEIKKGDKRIILINGEAVPYGLLRVPKAGEIRGNLAAGGKGIAFELNDRDRIICETVGPTLREKGLVFVGIDVIGGYLTEINVTSPTCVREIDAAYNISICDQLLDYIRLTLGVNRF